MEYKIVWFDEKPVNEKVKEFEKMVNELIKNGWQPQGGISYYSGHLFQAMVKNK